jgi:hypothetical protein
MLFKIVNIYMNWLKLLHTSEAKTALKNSILNYNIKIKLDEITNKEFWKFIALLISFDVILYIRFMYFFFFTKLYISSRRENKIKIDLGDSNAEEEAGRALSSRYSENVNVGNAK